MTPNPEKSSQWDARWLSRHILSGIPLVGFFRILRHILNPEFGETRFRSSGIDSDSHVTSSCIHMVIAKRQFSHFSQCSTSLRWWKFLILYPNRKRAAGPISGVPHLGTVANDIQRQTAHGMRDNQHQPCDARAGLAGADGRLCMLCCLLCQGQRACQDSTAPWEIKAMWWPNLTSRCKAEKWLSRTNRQSQNTLPLRFRWQFVCMIISRKWKSITQIQSIDSFQSKNSILHSK